MFIQQHRMLLSILFELSTNNYWTVFFQMTCKLPRATNQREFRYPFFFSLLLSLVHSYFLAINRKSSCFLVLHSNFNSLSHALQLFILSQEHNVKYLSPATSYLMMIVSVYNRTKKFIITRNIFVWFFFRWINKYVENDALHLSSCFSFTCLIPFCLEH